MKNITEEISSLTKEELIKNLITLDGRGKEFKETCLEKLLGDTRVETYNYWAKEFTG